MALSEGLKGFVNLIKNGCFVPEEDPFTDLAGDVIYETDGPLAKDIDKMYGGYDTKVTPNSRADRPLDRENGKVVSHPNSYKSSEVTVVEPRSFSESAQIVKKLLDKKTVILHLDLLDKEQSQRTIDFVCGASHALSGTAQKISDMVFIFTPSNVSLSVENSQLQSKFSESLWK